MLRMILRMSWAISAIQVPLTKVMPFMHWRQVWLFVPFMHLEGHYVKPKVFCRGRICHSNSRKFYLKMNNSRNPQQIEIIIMQVPLANINQLLQETHWIFINVGCTLCWVNLASWILIIREKPIKTSEASVEIWACNASDISITAKQVPFENCEQLLGQVETVVKQVPLVRLNPGRELSRRSESEQEK